MWSVNVVDVVIEMSVVSVVTVDGVMNVVNRLSEPVSHLLRPSCGFPEDVSFFFIYSLRASSCISSTYVFRKSMYLVQLRPVVALHLESRLVCNFVGRTSFSNIF